MSQRVQKWEKQNVESITETAIRPDEEMKKQLIERPVAYDVPYDKLL